jgi:iron complex outermembrane recepter protein
MRSKILRGFIPFMLLSVQGYSQAKSDKIVVSTLKKMSMEELMNIEVTSVSKIPEKLTGIPSAIQVITEEDIKYSGATNVPEALRLASNLYVFQVNSSQWAISARGFTNVLSNKLLVLIDGRAVYTPMYGGVFWDVQNLILEDIKQIEVISGAGGTLWGANAVNGVINITTKSSKETQGLFAEVAAGTELQALGSLRYGGKIKENVSYRIGGTAFKRGNTILNNGDEAHDSWTMGKMGFRMDWDISDHDQFTLQSDYYSGEPDPDGNAHVIAKGANVLARWTHNSSENRGYKFQIYFDNTFRDFRNGLTEKVNTYDIEFQNSIKIHNSHNLVWGLNLRFLQHRVDNLELFAFLPANKNLLLYSLFVRDEITLIKEKLKLSLGTKIEHNIYTGFEYQPSGRLSFNATKNQIIWGSVSRAVRTPARIDRDFYLYAAPNDPLISGDSFDSEDLLATELGWRLQRHENFSFSLATFYNYYDNLRTVEPGTPPTGLPLTFGNGLKGKTYGIEFSSLYQLTDWWRLRGGYTLFNKELTVKSNSHDRNNGTAESNDPRHQFLLQTMLDLSRKIEVGGVIRGVSQLTTPKVPGYVTLDLRLAWKPVKAIEIALVGQNLTDDKRTEFIPSSPSPRKIQRNIYGKILCRF